MSGERFVDADLSGAEFRNVNLTGARFREAQMVNVRISGLIDGLVVNDVEVGPLIDAELRRRFPEREKLRPKTAAEAREAWAVCEGLWTATKARMEAVPESTLHERVDGEWSALETVRHLVFVIDAWILGRVLNRTKQFHPLGVAPTFITDLEPFGLDLDADPPRAEVVAAREERMAIVNTLVDGLADEDLKRPCGDRTMRDCLWTLFEEEWAHNWYANRDLDTLTR